MPTLKQDPESVRKELEGAVRDLLSNLIDGSIAELDGPIRKTAEMLTLAARRGRMDLMEAARDQLELIVIEKEYRVKDEVRHFFGSALGIAFNALVRGAIAGLSGITVLP